MFEQDLTRQWTSGVPQKATKENVSVVGQPRECLGEAAAFLARCLRASSNVVDLFPDERVTDGCLHEPGSTGRCGLLPRSTKGAASEGEDPPAKKQGLGWAAVRR